MLPCPLVFLSEAAACTLHISQLTSLPHATNTLLNPMARHLDSRAVGGSQEAVQLKAEV